MTPRLPFRSAPSVSTGPRRGRYAAVLALASTLTLLAGCGGRTAASDSATGEGVSHASGSADPSSGGSASTPPTSPRKSDQPHVDSRGDLPALFPAAEGSVGIGGSTTVQEGTTAVLRGGTGDPVDGEVGDGDVRLVLDTGSSGDSAPVPAGWSPSLLRQGLSTPGGVGLVVSQEGGDSDTWTVFAWHVSTLTRAARAGHAPLGGGFTADGMHAFISWLTPEGRLFTRVGLDREGHFRVYEWRLEGTRLHAQDLGEVCIDLQAQPVAYRRC